MTSMAIILALLPEAHRLATVPETNGPLLHAVIDDMITSPPADAGRGAGGVFTGHAWGGKI